MTLLAPVVEWYNVDKTNPINTNTVPVAQPFDFGVIDAGYTPVPSDYYSFIIFNNRNNLNENAPQMEEVTIGVRDSGGGLGTESGKEVWAINGATKWFYAKVDSLGETDANFAQIGAELTKPIGAGTTNSTTNPNASKAVAWASSHAYLEGDVVKPTVDNGFIYIAKADGTSDVSQPTWSTNENTNTVDGSVEWIPAKKVKAPTANNIILGGVNSSNPAVNPNWATESAGNYSKVTLKLEAPLDARSGRQDTKVRVSFRYI